MKLPDKLLRGISRARFSILTVSILTFTGLAVFSNTYVNGFHLDDFHTLLFNSHVHSLEEIPSFFLSGAGFSGSPFIAGYRPLTSTLNALNYAVSEANPSGYHLINLFIHLLVSLLVSQIAFLLSGKGSVSLLSGLLYLVHPMNTEVVNYISARSSSLSTLFYLAAFWAFLRFRQEGRKHWNLLSIGFFILALLSKEASVTFPLLLIAYDYFYSPDLPFRRKAWSWLLYIVPVLFFLIARNYYMHPFTGPSTASTPLSGIHIADTAQRIFLGSLYLSTHYLLLYLFPYPLTADHPFPELSFDWTFAIFILLWGGILSLIILYRKKPLVPFLSSWFIITLIPLFLLPGITTLSLFQENRSYLSGTGICILLSLGIVEGENILKKIFPNRVPNIPVFLVISLLILFSYTSYHRNQVWKNEITLWTDGLRKNPSSFIACFSLGYGYLSERQLEKAGDYFIKSLELSPPRDYLYYIHNNLGAVYENQGKMEKAYAEYQTAVGLSPGLPEAHLNLGHFYFTKGFYEKTLEEMENAMDTEHNHMEQRVRTAIELENQGARKEALHLFLKISTLLPQTSEYKTLRHIVENHLARDSSLPPE